MDSITLHAGASLVDEAAPLADDDAVIASTYGDFMRWVAVPGMDVGTAGRARTLGNGNLYISMVPGDSDRVRGWLLFIWLVAQEYGFGLAHERLGTRVEYEVDAAPRAPSTPDKLIGHIFEGRRRDEVDAVLSGWYVCATASYLIMFGASIVVLVSTGHFEFLARYFEMLSLVMFYCTATAMAIRIMIGHSMDPIHAAGQFKRMGMLIWPMSLFVGFTIRRISELN